MATKPLPAADAEARTRRVSDVLALVGNTPLLRIGPLARDVKPEVRVFAKMEGFNPGGSVKDRPALNMIQDGLATGKLRPGKTILDSTSGNTGIALAMCGAVLGYPVELVVPENASAERKKIIGAFGARIIYSSPLEGSDGAILLCREVIARDPERYFKPDQYSNPANVEAHYRTTGPEIWRQTEGTITHFLAGIGTGGTIMGTGRYLKERNPEIQVIAVEPDDAFHGLEGLKHMATSIVPAIYDEAQLDGKIPVATDDAYDIVRRIGTTEGIVVGQSSGAALFAALELARTLERGTIVTIFPDFGDRYLSTNLWIGWRR